MKCERCNKNHTGSYGSGRFCSSFCARGFSTDSKRSMINDKVSRSLSGERADRKIVSCVYCNKKMRIRVSSRQKCCSSSCRAKFIWTRKEYRNNISKKLKIAAEEGRIGWNSRDKISYAESFWKDVLDNMNILYIHEYKVGKYFIDFAIKDKMIALEIDGKQHEYEDRIISDKKKDNFLKKEGWIVHRIKWNEINSVSGKKLMKQKIENFFQVWASLV